MPYNLLKKPTVFLKQKNDTTKSIKMKVEDIKNIANPILEAKNLFLVDLKISGENVIELYIDALTGVNIQTCIEISRETATKKISS